MSLGEGNLRDNSFQISILVSLPKNKNYGARKRRNPTIIPTTKKKFGKIKKNQRRAKVEEIKEESILQMVSQLEIHHACDTLFIFIRITS